MGETRTEMPAELDEPKAPVKKLTPQTSSVPPSTVHPHARPPARPKSKKKRAGQQGHPRNVRELVPWNAAQERVRNKFPNALRTMSFVIPAQAGNQFSQAAGFPPARE